MEYLNKYIQEILGETIHLEKLTKNMPFHIHLSYNVYRTRILNNEIILIENKNIEDFKILQTEKHIEILRDSFNTPIVLLLNELASYNRLRLIEKRINFIVAGKQIYLPSLLMDFRESFMPHKEHKKHKKDTLIPSAQMIVLYHLFNKSIDIKNLSFREIAEKMEYTSMTITKAIKSLKQFDLIEINRYKSKIDDSWNRTREKRIIFTDDRRNLWIKIKNNNYFCDPVIKKVYIDEIPNHTKLLLSGESALAEYSDMNPSRQRIFAIEKNAYYALKKSNELLNENKNEGLYCLEVWKYNPQTLANIFNENENIVDPLSLYCSFIHDSDERIQMALEQIENKYLW